jgi:hypothetical protein
MTDRTATTPSTTAASRRTAVLLVAWLAAAVLAGLPANAAGTANAQPRAAQLPIVQNTGPECFAGHTPPPAANKNGD